MLNRYINITIWCFSFLGVGLLTYQVAKKHGNYVDYVILFEESVGGLYTGSQVFLNGMAIGTVEDLELFTENVEKSLVIVRTKKIKHVDRIRAEISMTGITGHSKIDMYYVQSPADLEKIRGMTQIKSNLSLFGKIRSKLNLIANDDNFDVIIKSVTQSIDSIKVTFSELRNVMVKLNVLVDDVDFVARCAPSTIARINKFMDSANQLIEMINDSHLPVLLNRDLKIATYSSNNLRKIMENIRIITAELKRRPLSFLTNGYKEQ